MPNQNAVENVHDSLYDSYIQPTGRLVGYATEQVLREHWRYFCSRRTDCATLLGEMPARADAARIVTEWLACHRAALVRTVRGWCSEATRPWVDDVVQELFVVLRASLERYFDPQRGSIPIWVAMLVRRIMGRWSRAAEPVGGLEPDEIEALDKSPEEVVGEREQIARATAARATLPGRDALVLQLGFLESADHHQVGRQLGLSHSNAKVSRFRALGRLRAALQQAGRRHPSAAATDAPRAVA